MSLDAADRRLMRLFTAAVLGRFDEVVRVRAHAGPGEPDRRWREAVLQVHVFAGFPRLVETYGALEAAGGLGTPEPDEMRESTGAARPPGDDARSRGLALFERIYRTDASGVLAMLQRQHPDFSAWILEHAYGRVLARTGLAADRRELLAVCALAALGQERQLASHVRGSLRCGATREEIDQALASVADLIEPSRLGSAGRVIERFGNDSARD